MQSNEDNTVSYKKYGVTEVKKQTITQKNHRYSRE